MISWISDDVEEIEDLMLSGVASALAYLFQLVFFVGALFYLDWQLALISLIVAPLFFFAARNFSRKIKSAAREKRRLSGSISAVAEESLSNATLVQAYNRQDAEVERFRRENEGNFLAQMAATRLSALFSPLVDLIELAGVMLVLGLGAYGLSQGRLSLGGLLIFMVYLVQLYRPIRGLSSLLNSFYSASAGAERIIEFLDEEPSVVERDEAISLDRSRGRVEFDLVAFGYPGTGKETLSGLSFDVSPGGDARARRAQRRREVYGRQAPPALLRPRSRRGAARRPRPEGAEPALAAGERRGAVAGDAGLRRHHSGEYWLRQAGGDRGGDSPRRESRRRPRVHRKVT
jgi:ATP-binding cassette subfamily B protein